jgi:hypothetical protein
MYETSSHFNINRLHILTSKMQERRNERRTESVILITEGQFKGILLYSFLLKFPFNINILVTTQLPVQSVQCLG